MPITAPGARRPPWMGERIQLGHVVAGMEPALAFWTGSLGVGPFVLIDDPVGDAAFIHRGRPSPVRMSVAFSYVGDTMIELICQTGGAASPYTEFLTAGGTGLHHVGVWPEDFEQACSLASASGFSEVAFIAAPDGTKSVSYLSSPPDVGMMIELIRRTPFRDAYGSAMRRLARGWDGELPVRRHSTFADFAASAGCG